MYDPQGREVTIDPYGDDSQFMEPCSEEEISAMKDFVSAFVVPYARFFGTKAVYVNAGELKNFVRQGSEFEERINLFI